MRKGFKRKFFVYLSFIKKTPFLNCILTGAIYKLSKIKKLYFLKTAQNSDKQLSIYLV